MGDNAVGKTSLFNELITETFEPNIISSLGLDKRTLSKRINTPKDGEKKVDIYLFDTAGKEQFRTISVSYLRDLKGVLIIYDITNNESFQNLEK